MTAWILGLDASTPTTLVVVGDGDRGTAGLVHYDVVADANRPSSETLHLRIDDLRRRAGLERNDLTAVACGCGPGSFTGIRVALATAKGLALGFGVGLYPVSSLAMVAATFSVVGPVLALVDARRGEVYGGLFELDAQGLPTAVTEPSCAPVADLIAGLPVATGHAIGSGVPEHGLPPGWAVLDPPAPSPEGLWRGILAARRIGPAVAPEDVTAMYLRKSYAELGVNQAKRLRFASPFVKT